MATTVMHGGQAGRAIVDEARQVKAEEILTGVARKRRSNEHIFGRTVDEVLRHAPCRVVIASDAAAPDTTSAAAVSAALSDAVARPPGPRSRPPDR